MLEIEYLLCQVIDHEVLVDEGVEFIYGCSEFFKKYQSEEMLMRIRCDTPLSAETNCSPLHIFSVITDELVNELLGKELEKKEPDNDKVCQLLDSAFHWGLVLDRELVTRALKIADLEEARFYADVYDKILDSVEFRKELFSKLCSEKYGFEKAYALYQIDKKLGSNALDVEEMVKSADSFDLAILKMKGMIDGHDEEIAACSTFRDHYNLEKAFCHAVIGNIEKVREYLKEFKNSDVIRQLKVDGLYEKVIKLSEVKE